MKTILIAFLVYKQVQTTQPLKSKLSNLLALSGGQDSICLFLILIVWSFLSPVTPSFYNPSSLGGNGSTIFSYKLFQEVKQKISCTKKLKLKRANQLCKKSQKEQTSKCFLSNNRRSFNKSEKKRKISCYFNNQFERTNSFLNRATIIYRKSLKFDRHKKLLLVNSKFKLERKTSALFLRKHKNCSIGLLRRESFLTEGLTVYHKQPLKKKGPLDIAPPVQQWSIRQEWERLQQQVQKLTFNYFKELAIPISFVPTKRFCNCPTLHSSRKSLGKRNKCFIKRKTLSFAEKKVFFSNNLLARQIRLSFHKRTQEGSEKLTKKVNFASVWCNHLWQKDGFYTMRELIRLSFLWKIPFYGSIAFFPNLTEQKARLWRYKSFGRLLAFYNFNQLITGHTATDRTETLLLHLLRGSGTAGLISIPWKKPFSLPLSNPFSKSGCSFFSIKKSS